MKKSVEISGCIVIGYSKIKGCCCQITLEKDFKRYTFGGFVSEMNEGKEDEFEQDLKHVLRIKSLSQANKKIVTAFSEPGSVYVHAIAHKGRKVVWL